MEKMNETYGREVILTGPVICNDGSRWEDYTWEEHLYYLGFSAEEPAPEYQSLNRGKE